MSNFEAAQHNQPAGKLKGWHVLMCFIGFFGLMFAVNGVFLYHAITSFPGEDVKKSYVQGLDYNRTLSARKAQRALGWNAQAGFEQDRLIFKLRDSNDQIVYAHRVDAEIRHSATTQKDQTLTLTRSPTGEYAAEVSELGAGQWTVRFKVFSQVDNSLIFEAQKNIVVLP